MVALFVVSIVVVALTADYFLQLVQRQHQKVVAAIPVANTGAVALEPPPDGVHLTNGHTWAHLETTGITRLGADAIVAALLGPPDRVVLLSKGSHVRRGDRLATLSRGQRSITLRAPVNGRITEFNADLLAHPESVNDDPYGRGWLYGMNVSQIDDINLHARRGTSAVHWLRTETARLRDTLGSLRAQPALVGSTMLDGGDFGTEPLSDALSDEAWAKVVHTMFDMFD